LASISSARRGRWSCRVAVLAACISDSNFKEPVQGLMVRVDAAVRQRWLRRVGRAKRAHRQVQRTSMVGTLRFAHPTASSHASAFPRHDVSGFCKIICPSQNRGRRESRALVAPAALRASEESTQASHHRYAETIRPSLRDGLAAYTRSPRSAGLASLRPPGLLTRGLIPASGDQDHAISPSARCAFVSCARASIASRAQHL
jgi:hypothetical protein